MKHKNYKISDLKEVRAFTGGAAAAEALRQMNPDVMAVYPITPQTPIIETYAQMKADGKVDTEIIQVESEHSAMSATVGAQAAGARSVTATSSQGLALMHEILYIASGLRLPSLMYVSSRALSAPLSIHGEHGDVMAVRDSGWIQIFSQDAQEAYDLGFIGMRVAEQVRFPLMAIMDGFSVSHTTERIETISDENVKQFVGEYNPEKYLLDFENPVSFGTLALQNTYMDFRMDQSKDFDEALSVYKKNAKEYKKVSGRFLDIYDSYKIEDAENVIVIMGATIGTVKEVVDKLREKGEKVGVLGIRLFRPFPYKEVGAILSHAKKIAVLDKAVSLGAYPPLYGEISNAVHHATSRKVEISSYVYGLGGRDTFQKDIEKVYKDLAEGDISDKIKFIK